MGETDASNVSKAKKGHSGCCKCLCCVCCCCTLVIATLGATAGVLYSAYEEPSVDVTNTTFNSFNISYNGSGVATGVDLNVAVTIQIDNPSRRPIEFTLKKIDSRVYSLDSTAPGQVGDPELIGDAVLDREVRISADSVTDVVMTTATTPETGSNPTLALRLDRHCSAVSAPRETRMRVHILAATIGVYGIDARLQDVSYDFVVPCGA